MLFAKKHPTGQVTGPVELRGDLAFLGSGTFAARLDGNLSAAESLTIEANATVNGSVRARNLHINGTISGPVQSADALHLHPPARLSGSLTASTLTIESGAQFHGDLAIGPNP